MSHNKLCTSSSLPLAIYIEPTNLCNLKCKMCHQSLDIVREKGMMDMGLFKSIIDQVGQIENYKPRIGLHMNGEPLLHKNFPEMVRYATAKKNETFIHTNGMLLTKTLGKKIIDAGISEVTFSFEGENPKRYESLRQNAKFEQVRENILDFLRSKKDTVVIIEVLKFRGQDNLELNKEFKKQFPGVKFRSYFASDWCGTFDNQELKETSILSKNSKPCLASQQVMAVAWNGKVLTCCLDFNSVQVIGDLNNESLCDVWLGENRNKFLHKMKTGKFETLPVCGQCSAPYTVTTKERILTQN